MRETFKFLRRLTLYSPLLAAAVLVDIGLNRVENSYNTKRRLFEARAASVEVLALGSSVAAMGIKPDEFSAPAFNLANISQSLIVDSQLFRKYLPSLPKLKVLIVSLLYPSLESKLSGAGESWRNFFYSRFFAIPGDGTALENLDVRSVSLFHLYGRNDALAYMRKGFHSGFDRLDEFGWQPSDGGLWESAEKSADRWITNHHKGMHVESLPGNVAALEKMVEAAQNKGVKVAIVGFPTIEAYAHRTRPEVIERTRRVVEDLFQKYPATVTSKDYFRDSRFGDADFSDADHLNRDGAKKLSRLIDEELIRPLIGQPPRDLATP